MSNSAQATTTLTEDQKRRVWSDFFANSGSLDDVKFRREMAGKHNLSQQSIGQQARYYKLFVTKNGNVQESVSGVAREHCFTQHVVPMTRGRAEYSTTESAAQAGKQILSVNGPRSYAYNNTRWRLASGIFAFNKMMADLDTNYEAAVRTYGQKIADSSGEELRSLFAEMMSLSREPSLMLQKLRAQMLNVVPSEHHSLLGSDLGLEEICERVGMNHDIDLSYLTGIDISKVV